jgi:ribonuclease P protein component
VGGAVERNRVKRLLREAFARRRDAIAGAYDVVIVARPDVLELAEREGVEGIAATLDELLVRAGVVAPEEAPS